MGQEMQAYQEASLQDRYRYAEAIASAGDLVPKGLRDGNRPNPGKVLLAMEYGTMLGFHPMVGVNTINVIDGKVSVPPALMQSLVRNAGHKLRVRKSGTIEGGDYAVTVELVRSDDPDEPFTTVWTPQRAARAGLCEYRQEGQGQWRVVAMSQDRGHGSHPLPWMLYTEAMLKARAISEVVMEGATDVMMGRMYVPEELGALVNESGEVVDDQVQDAVVIEDEAPQQRQQDQQQPLQGPPVQEGPTADDAEVASLMEALETCTTVDQVTELWREVQAAGQLDLVVDTIPETGETLTLRQAMIDRVNAMKLRAESGVDQARPDEAQTEAQGTLEQTLDAQVVEGGNDDGNPS